MAKISTNSLIASGGCDEDMPLLQEVVRSIRKAGGVTGADYCAGIHVHIDGEPYTAQGLRKLVNIFASKENFLFDMLQVSPMLETYCQKVDREFLEKLNKQKPKTIEGIQRLWYKGDMNEVHHHYSSMRYRACNLHSFFATGNMSNIFLIIKSLIFNDFEQLMQFHNLCILVKKLKWYI